MAGIGTFYDLSASQYSPDGRVFQIEYAQKAVDSENSGTAVAFRVKDGIVFGIEKLIVSKMLVPGSNRRISAVSNHAGMAFAGLVADARNLVERARSEAAEYLDVYDHEIPIRVLADRVASFMSTYTLYSHVRPFGVSVLIGGIDAKGPQLYQAMPSGVSYGYFGCTAGKGRLAAKTEMEKLKLSEMTCREAVKEIARIIYSVHDDIKDKDFELEMCWICPESNNSLLSFCHLSHSM